MGTALVAAVAAIRTIKAADGKEYRLSPLTLRDYAQLDLWLEKEVVERARRVFADEKDEKVRSVEIRLAQREAQTITWETLKGAELICTPEGVARLLYLALHHNHTELTLEQVKDMITTDILSLLVEEARKANVLVNPTEAGVESQSPAPALE